MFKIIILALSFFAVTSIKAEAKLEGTQREVAKLLSSLPKSVQISSYVEKTLKFSQAEATFIIRSKEDKLSEAIDENNRIYDKITKEFSKTGYAAGNLSTDPFSVIPKYSFYQNAPTSFYVQKVFRAELSNEQDFLNILKVTEEYDDIQFLKLDPKKIDTKSLKQELEIKCLKELEAKKELYEKALRAKLIINEFDVSYPADFLQPALNGQVKKLSKVSVSGPASHSHQINAFGKFTITCKLNASYLLFTRD